MAVLSYVPQANSMNMNGQYGKMVGQYSADPDIAAQGAQARQTQKAGFDFQTARMNRLLPMLQGAMNGMGNFGATGVATDVGPPPPAPMGGGPHIQGGPLWTQQDIQGNVNANRAFVDRSIASQDQKVAGTMAGRGMGSGASSPMIAALSNQNFMAGLGQKADYERQFLPQARQQNAQFGLDTAKARESQFAARNNETLGYGQNLLGYGQNLLGDARNRITAQGQAMQMQTNLLGQLANLM